MGRASGFPGSGGAGGSGSGLPSAPAAVSVGAGQGLTYDYYNGKQGLRAVYAGEPPVGWAEQAVAQGESIAPQVVAVLSGFQVRSGNALVDISTLTNGSPIYWDLSEQWFTVTAKDGRRCGKVVSNTQILVNAPLFMSQLAGVSTRGPLWATGADFVNGNLAVGGSLDWTIATGVPTGVSDGANTTLNVPDVAVDDVQNGFFVQLCDGDNNDTVVDQALIPLSSQDNPRLYPDPDHTTDYVQIEVSARTKTIQVSAAQSSSNRLTGCFLKVYPAGIYSDDGYGHTLPEGVSLPLPVSSGGTGAGTPNAGRTNLKAAAKADIDLENYGWFDKKTSFIEGGSYRNDGRFTLHLANNQPATFATVRKLGMSFKAEKGISSSALKDFPLADLASGAVIRFSPPKWDGTYADLTLGLYTGSSPHVPFRTGLSTVGYTFGVTGHSVHGLDSTLSSYRVQIKGGQGAEILYERIVDPPTIPTVPDKASQDDVDGETDDTDYMTVAKTLRLILRKVKTASRTVVGQTRYATNAEADATESAATDSGAVTPKLWWRMFTAARILARLQTLTGTADNTTILYGDGAWRTAPAGGGGSGGAAHESTVTEAETGGGTGIDRMSARRTKQAIDAQRTPDIFQKDGVAYYLPAGGADPVNTVGSYKPLSAANTLITTPGSYNWPSDAYGVRIAKTDVAADFVDDGVDRSTMLAEVVAETVVAFHDSSETNTCSAFTVSSVVDRSTAIDIVFGSRIEEPSANFHADHNIEFHLVREYQQVESLWVKPRLFQTVQKALLVSASFLSSLRHLLLPEPEHTILTGWTWTGEYDANDIPVVDADSEVGEVNPSQLWTQASNAQLPDIIRYMRLDHTYRVVKDANNWIEYKVRQASASTGTGNQRYFAFRTFNPLVTSKEKQGTIAKGDSVSLQLSPAFLTNDRIKDTINPDSTIDVPTSKAVADYADAGDDEAHKHIGLVAEFLDIFYEGWTSVSGANYSAPADIVANLPVDLSSDANATVPTADNPVILRPNNTIWTNGPTGIVWALDFLSGTARYVLGITANGADQILYKRVNNAWTKLWEDGVYEDGAASDPVFMDHWYDVTDGDVKVANSLETRRHQWSIPGVSADNMALYRRGTGDKDGKDVAAMIPNWGGAGIIDYSWNRFILPPAKNGVHRRNVTELQGTTGGSAPGLSLMTAAYTPKKANARIFVKLRIAASCTGNSDNDYSQLNARVKRGSGNYKRMDEVADGYTAISGERMWQYSDNTARAHYDEFVLEPQDNTDEIKVNVSIYMKDAASVSSTTGRLNRWGTNRNIGPSWIEIYEMAPGGEMEYQTATTLDAA